MKNVTRLIIVLCCLILLSSRSFSQPNFEENFDYPTGDNLSNHGWSARGTPGVYPILVVSGSLSFPGYSSSSIGNSVDVIGSSESLEDLTINFNIDSASNVYCSFLVKVASIGTIPDYFFHLREDPVPTVLPGKVFIKDNGVGGFNFGLSKQSDTVIAWDITPRNFGETYLVVIKYEYVTGTDNDLIRMFINPPLTGTEPTTADLTNPDINTDLIINAVSVRQGSQTYNVQLDGINVSDSWPVTSTETTLTAPNGGENWQVNSIQNILWTNTDVANVKARIHYEWWNNLDYNNCIDSGINGKL